MTSPQNQQPDVSPAAGAVDVDEAYPPIGDYGVVGDCRTVALISRAGAVDWLCLPHCSGPAWFAALLDRRNGGTFRIRPRGEYRVSRRYLPDTNVLETRFTTHTGEATLTDALVMLPYADEPGTLGPQSELLRSVAVTRGRVALDVHYQPRPDYGRRAARLTARSGRTLTCRDGGHYLVLQSERPLELTQDAAHATATVELREQETWLLSLAHVQRDMGILPPLGELARRRLSRTCRWWRDWARDCAPDVPHRDMVVRSVLVMKLLQHALTGALIASPTTSLPEVPGGSRNWDYRFCWLRDAGLTVQSFAHLGYGWEAGHFVDWLLHATRLTRPELNVMYDVFGHTSLHERELDHLEGYRRSAPVRVGNGAMRQTQLDVYGEVIEAAALYVQSGGGLDRHEARLLRGFGDAICRNWREPGAGIWEIRGRPRHYTYSKMLCWSGLEILLELDADGHIEVSRKALERERDTIVEAIEEHGFSRRHQAYVQAFDNDLPDASLLRAARDYVVADDPRMTGTYEYVERELGAGPLIYRYPPGSDGLPGREGAFVMTSFWAVEYLALAGRTTEARSRFERLIELSSDLGLFAEEIDPATGQALGNFPQAFSHGALITAALALRDATTQ